VWWGGGGEGSYYRVLKYDSICCA